MAWLFIKPTPLKTINPVLQRPRQAGETKETLCPIAHLTSLTEPRTPIPAGFLPFLLLLDFCQISGTSWTIWKISQGLMGYMCTNISIHFSEESGFICLCVCGRGRGVSFLRRTILDTWPAWEVELLWGIWQNTETLHDFGCGSVSWSWLPA